MFEVEEWAANKTADDLSQKLFTKKKLKRKNGDCEVEKPAKIYKLDSPKKSKKRKNREQSEPDVDDLGNKTKHQKRVHPVSKQPPNLVSLKTKSPKVKKDKRRESDGTQDSGKQNSAIRETKRSQDPVKHNSAIPKTKSPRNKYKHLAIKKQEQNKDKNELPQNTGEKNNDKTVSNHKKLTKPEHRLSVETPEGEVKIKNEKKKRLKSKDLAAASAGSDGKPTVTVKETKRRRKRKKKNNPKKNKYRHLILSKSMEAESEELKADNPPESPEVHGKPKKSPKKSPAFNVIKLKQTLSSSGIKSGKKDKKATNSDLVPHTNKSKINSGKRNINDKKGEKSEKKDKNPTNLIPCTSKKSEVKSNMHSMEEEMEYEEEKGKPELTLKQKVTAKLNSARFRYLNEQLYTQTGEASYSLFAEDQEAFKVYHSGFQSQVEKWPSNPLDSIIKYISKRPASVTVADFGCGDARLARSLPNQVHSFDLVALNDHVTPCDMAQVPLEGGSVDICVFCLSLMGTNLVDYLTEANRVLKPGGILKIAEVSSRFDSLPAFISSLQKLGFNKINQNTSNKMFITLDFKKVSRPTDASVDLALKPCVYKKR